MEDIIDFKNKTLDQTLDIYIDYGVIDGFTGEIIKTIEDKNKKVKVINEKLDDFFREVKWDID